MLLNGVENTPEEVLNIFILLMEKYHIFHLKTISCFGGNQKSFKKGKFDIKSCHDYHEEILCQFSDNGLRYCSLSEYINYNGKKPNIIY